MLQRARPSPGRRRGSSPQIGKIKLGYVSGQQGIRVQINDSAVLREQTAGHQTGIRERGVAVLVAVLEELAELFRKLQERKGNLRKGGGDRFSSCIIRASIPSWTM